MDQFIHQQNVDLYRKLLAQTDSEVDRQLIRKLLAEEEAKVFPEPRKKLSSFGLVDKD